MRFHKQASVAYTKIEPEKRSNIMPYSVMLDAGHGGFQLCQSKEKSIYPVSIMKD